MSDEKLEAQLELATNEFARTESDLRPALLCIERRAKRRRRRSTIARGTFAAACLAAVIVIGLFATTHRQVHRVTTAGPTTSVAGKTTSSTASAPVRTLPWISTVIEPNTRANFVHTLDASGVHDAPSCTLGDLLVTLTINGAGGADYAGIDVRNETTHPCSVEGSPYVGILDTAGRTLAEYRPYRAATDKPVVLVQSSWASVGLTEIGADRCGGPSNDAQAGTTAAAIAFGITAGNTRVVRPTPDYGFSQSGCPPSIVGTAYTGAFHPVAVDYARNMLYEPLHDGMAIEAPRQVRRGEPARYSITVTNTSMNTFALVDDICPLYRESLGNTKSGTLVLNCGGREGLLIAPGRSARFEMQLDVPANQPLGATKLRWQFVEPEEPALIARVEVTDH